MPYAGKLLVTLQTAQLRVTLTGVGSHFRNEASSTSYNVQPSAVRCSVNLKYTFDPELGCLGAVDVYRWWLATSVQGPGAAECQHCSVAQVSGEEHCREAARGLQEASRELQEANRGLQGPASCVPASGSSSRQSRPGPSMAPSPHQRSPE